MSFNAYNIEPIRGRSHEAKGTECQDSCASYADPAGRFAIAIVSDGHGGKKYVRSKVGSQTAVDISIETLKSYMEDYDSFKAAVTEDPRRFLIDRVAKRILGTWFDRIGQHARDNPLTEEELKLSPDVSYPENRYGATLVIAVITESFAFAIQVGDGDIVFVGRDGVPFMPVPEDSKCEDNITTSICGHTAWTEDVRTWFTSENVPVAATCSSDGVSTTFPTMEGFMKYMRRPAVIVASDLEKDSLVENLVLRSRSNREDDVSLSVVCDVRDMSVFENISRTLEEEIANRKLRPGDKLDVEPGGYVRVDGDPSPGEVMDVYPATYIGDGAKVPVELLFTYNPPSVSEDAVRMLDEQVKAPVGDEVVNRAFAKTDVGLGYVRRIPEGVSAADYVSGAGTSADMDISAALDILRLLEHPADPEGSRLPVRSMDAGSVWIVSDPDSPYSGKSRVMADYALVSGQEDPAALSASLSRVLFGILMHADPAGPAPAAALSRMPGLDAICARVSGGGDPVSADEWFDALFACRTALAAARPGAPSLHLRLNGADISVGAGSVLYADDRVKEADLPLAEFVLDGGTWSAKNLSGSPWVADSKNALAPGGTYPVANYATVAIDDRHTVSIPFEPGPGTDLSMFRMKGVITGEIRQVKGGPVTYGVDKGDGNVFLWYPGGAPDGLARAVSDVSGTGALGPFGVPAGSVDRGGFGYLTTVPPKSWPVCGFCAEDAGGKEVSHISAVFEKRILIAIRLCRLFSAVAADPKLRGFASHLSLRLSDGDPRPFLMPGGSGEDLDGYACNFDGGPGMWAYISRVLFSTVTTRHHARFADGSAKLPDVLKAQLEKGLSGAEVDLRACLDGLFVMRAEYVYDSRPREGDLTLTFEPSLDRGRYSGAITHINVGAKGFRFYSNGYADEDDAEIGSVRTVSGHGRSSVLVVENKDLDGTSGVWKYEFGKEYVRDGIGKFRLEVYGRPPADQVDPPVKVTPGPEPASEPPKELKDPSPKPARPVAVPYTGERYSTEGEEGSKLFSIDGKSDGELEKELRVTCRDFDIVLLWNNADEASCRRMSEIMKRLGIPFEIVRAADPPATFRGQGYYKFRTYVFSR